jgi:predicted kinase
MLVVFSGLPGTGKTTVGHSVATRLEATFLRIDAIEQAILKSRSGGTGIGVEGYAVANAIAESNLRLGRRVVADCVNPVEASRAAWRAVANRASVRIVEVEVICSDTAEHRRRLEQRRSDIPGHVLPSWEELSRLTYERWIEPHLIIDTALLSADAAAEAVVRAGA